MPCSDFRMKILEALLYFVFSLPWQSVGSLQNPVITRNIYDLILFPDCGGQRNEDFNCDNVLENSVRTNDKRTCTCRCKEGYLVYRDPMVRYIGSGSYSYDVNTKGCVWYGTYREGCHVLDNVEEETFFGTNFGKPIIIDLTHSGNLTLKSEHYSFDCLNIVPYARVPGMNRWKRVDDIIFQIEDLKRPMDTKHFFELRWHSNNSDIYAYQGMIMRLDLHACFSSVILSPDCIMAKIAGSYTDGENCKRRTINGHCCVFPFVYKNTVYKACVSTDDMTEPWCAVSLDTGRHHNWRETCADQPTAMPTSPSLFVLTSKSSSNGLPTTSQLSRTTSPSVTISEVVTVPKTTTSQTIHSLARPSQTYVTISMKVPCETPLVPDADSSSDDHVWFDSRFIIGVAALLVLVFIVIFVIIICLCRKKRAGKRLGIRRENTLSNEALAEESPYATINLAGAPPQTTNYKNLGYRESIEMKPHRTQGVIRGYVDTDGGHSSRWHQNNPDNSPVYSMPEADYSLICTPSMHSMRSNTRPLPSPVSSSVSSSSHVYSVLERENDPLKFPHPTDNDRVFVEFNPLYGTVDIISAQDEHQADSAAVIYENPSDMAAKKRISDIPEVSEKDV